MKHIYILLLVLLTSIPSNAQTSEISSKYELQIKDQKIRDALSICFSNFDEYTKSNKLNVFKVYLSNSAPDELEMIIDFYSPNDTIKYTQPDNYFRFGEKIAFVYSGKTILTKMDDPTFHNFVLSVCREKMKSKNSNRPSTISPNVSKKDSNNSSIDRATPSNDVKVLPRETQGLVLERTFTFDPTLKYSIRKTKNKVTITSLKSGEI